MGYGGSSMKLSETYSNKQLLKPTWMKVTSTPWKMASQSTGGYARRVDDTTVSHDAPDFFHISHVVNHDPKTTLGTCAAVGQELRRKRQDLAKDMSDTCVSADSPDWFQIRDVVNPVKGPPIEIHRVNNQVMFEPVPQRQKDRTIDWGSAR